MFNEIITGLGFYVVSKGIREAVVGYQNNKSKKGDMVSRFNAVLLNGKFENQLRRNIPITLGVLGLLVGIIEIVDGHTDSSIPLLIIGITHVGEFLFTKKRPTFKKM